MARKSPRNSEVGASVTSIVSLHGDLELVSRVADADLLAPTFESSTGVGVVEHGGCLLRMELAPKKLDFTLPKPMAKTVVHLLPDAVVTKFIAVVSTVETSVTVEDVVESPVPATRAPSKVRWEEPMAPA